MTILREIAYASILLLLANTPVCEAMSYSGKWGHQADYSAIFEGISGDNYDELCKRVSKGIDKDFPEAFKKQFGKYPSGNHRIMGHWGFSGDIPFHKEPWKSAFADFPQKEVSKFWQKFVNELTEEASKKLGIPKKQARAFVGLLYDAHLLTDLKPPNKIIAPLADVGSITDDLIKNAKTLFGKHSPLFKELETQLKAIKATNPQQYADEVLKVLHKSPIGREFYRVYGRFFGSSIKYAELAKELKNHKLLKTPEVKKGSIAKANNQTIAKGVLLADGRLIASISGGAYAGLAVFTIDGGIATYNYYRGNTFKPEYERLVAEAAIKGASVGAATAVTILIGANPAGLVVIGVGIGSYWVAEKSLQKWHESQDRQYLTEADLKMFGIELNSSLDIDISKDLPLNFL